MDFSRFHVEISAELVWRMLFALCGICIILGACDSAFAAGGAGAAGGEDVIGQTLCRLVANLSGGIARGIATIAIFAVGVGLFLGKLNWGIAAATAAGVGIIFSAPQLVGFLSGNADNATCPTE